MYEAGVAEIYDYSMTGPDPLRELIQHFGLQTIPMDAEQVHLDGELLNDVPGMRRKYGAKTAGRDRGLPQALHRDGVPGRILRRRRRARQRASVGLHHCRGIARPGSGRCDRQALLQGDGALRYRHRKPQYQRAECAEELRDGCRRLYRPVFDPERQRAADRMPAVRGGRGYPAQSPGSQGRQDRGRAATSST